MDLIETFSKVRVIPVLVMERTEDAVPLAHALVAGGLKVLEITFRTTCAAKSIAAIRRDVPGAIVGAGTASFVRYGPARPRSRRSLWRGTWV